MGDSQDLILSMWMISNLEKHSTPSHRGAADRNQRDQPAIIRIIFRSGKLLLRFITGHISGASLSYVLYQCFLMFHSSLLQIGWGYRDWDDVPVHSHSHRCWMGLRSGLGAGLVMDLVLYQPSCHNKTVALYVSKNHKYVSFVR